MKGGCLTRALYSHLSDSRFAKAALIAASLAKSISKNLLFILGVKILTVKTQTQKRNHSLYMALVIIIIALLSGLIASLASALYTQNLTPPPPFVGSSTTGYGFPSTWLKKVTIVYPGSPTTYDLSLSGFLADFAFWSLLMGVLTAAIVAILTTVRARGGSKVLSPTQTSKPES